MDNRQSLRSGTPILATDLHHKRQLASDRPTCLRQGGSRLYVNQKLYNDENTLLLHFQPDGDICIYQRLPDDSAGALHWCAGVTNDEPDYMELSNSGHLQLVDKGNYPYFKSTLATNTGFVVLQNDEISNTNECHTPPYPTPPSTSSRGTSYMVAKNIPYIVAGVVALALIAMVAYWYNPKRASSRMVYVTGPDPVMASVTVEMGSVVNTENNAAQDEQQNK